MFTFKRSVRSRMDDNYYNNLFAICRNHYIHCGKPYQVIGPIIRYPLYYDILLHAYCIQLVHTVNLLK